MNRHLILSFKLILPLGLGLALAMLALSGLSGQRWQAQGACQRYVFSGGDDTTNCSNPASPCKSIQYALSQASDLETVCVAGDKDVPGPTVYPGSVVITREVMLDGSWLASGSPGSYTINHAECDPNKVWLDGQWAGTVMTLTSTAGKADVHCFTITRGRATGFCGGGIVAIYNAVSIRDNVITNNIALSGYAGGGICAYSDGAGIIIDRNTIISNSTVSSGGGLYLQGPDGFSLSFNRIAENNGPPGYANGISIQGTNAYLFSNQIVDNKNGNAVEFTSGLPAIYTLRAINNLVSGNQGIGFGFYGNRIELLHNTIVSNTGYAIYGSYTATITLTNNLIAYNTYGVMKSANTTLSGTHNLFWGNGSDPFTGTAAILGDPKLAADGYHLTAGSAAISAGTPISVDIDIDGENRSIPPDIGADEYFWNIFLALVRKN